MKFLKQGAHRAAIAAGAVLAALALASCGGGDPYSGLWEGTVDGNRPATAIVLGDGTYYLMYAGTPGTLGGVVRGQGEFRGTTFTSTNGVDYHFAYPLQRPTTATIASQINASGGNLGVSGTLNAMPLQLSYVKPFDPEGSLADLAGTYSGDVLFSLGHRPAVFEVSATGDLSTVVNGCTITGKAVPRADDAFDLSVTFGGAPCVFPGAVFAGAALYSHELQQLDAALVNPMFGQAITFIAKKNP